MQTEWDNRPGAETRRLYKTWQFYLRFCSLCARPFRTEFEHHLCCPACVAAFRQSIRAGGAMK